MSKKKIADKNNKSIGNIQGMLDKLNSNTASNENMVYGRAGDKYESSVDTALNTLKKLSDSGNTVTLNNLQKAISDGSSDEEAKKIKDHISAITNNNEKELLNNMIKGMSGTIQKMEDLALITTCMPQLRDVRRIYVSDILSPDDVTKKISLNIEYSGKDLAATHPELDKRIEMILKRSKFDKNLKRVVDTAVTTGLGFLSIMSYQDLFTDIIEKKNKDGKRDIKLTECVSADILLDESIINPVFESNTPGVPAHIQIAESIASVVNDVTVCEGTSSIYDEEILLAEISTKADGKDNISSIYDHIKKSANKEMKTDDKSKATVDGVMETGASSKKVTAPNISGDKVRLLDPKKVLTLKVDDTILGYYHVDVRKKKGVSNALNNNMLSGVGMSDGGEDAISHIYTQLGNAIIKKLDNKFIEKNEHFKDALYDILKHTNDGKTEYVITFLEPSELIPFELENGESPFINSILYGKLWMFTMIQHIMARVSRGNDIRAYYVNTSPEGGVAPQVMSAVNQLTRKNSSLLHYNSIPKLLNQATIFTDLLIPVNGSGESPIKYDIIDAQRIETPTELLEMLEKIAVDSSGHPLQLLQSGNEADFAKTYNMLNTKYLKNILSYQYDLQPGLCEAVKAIVRNNMAEDDPDMAIVDNLDISFRSPINLVLQNAIEQINNASEIANSVVENIVSDPDETDLVKGELKRAIFSDFVTLIDVGAYHDLYTNIRLNNNLLEFKKGIETGAGDSLDEEDEDTGSNDDGMGEDDDMGNF